MNNRILQIAALFLLPIGLVAALYVASGGSMEHHFHNSLADRTQQRSIHPVVVDSGFHLKQPIDTHHLNTARVEVADAPICLWLRIEYDRNSGWKADGTVLVRLITEDSSWSSSMKSHQITSYFQPICFPGSTASAVANRRAFVDISVLEPDLEKVAMFAMGPANGLNNAIINGKYSNHTLTYRLSANPGMQKRDALQIGGIFLLAWALLLCIWIPSLRQLPKTAGA